ncbi:DUF1638 domain-containing protein [Nisaea nitritireducens]|uniref:DUF1638 domain-containing protein n=1 Tax=Nisaea nitritireducens TaxID=568392 RepID=UPI0018689A64|nr:DUF1638 domain-containing protein [Nisaea nitritireducens]
MAASTSPERPRALVVACGALGRELVALKESTGWDALDITCLPAIWHNHPEKIAPGLRRKLQAAHGYERVFVAYGDCGTGGEVDQVIEEFGVERIAGPHCYQFFMGTDAFTALTNEDPACFFLTDYLVRHFDRLIVKGLGLDRFPELRDMYFGNYTALVYIAQTEDPRLKVKAEQAAERLGLAFEYRYRGYGELQSFIETAHPVHAGQ